MVEREAAREGAGREAHRLEARRGGRLRRRQAVARVVANAVLVRIVPGQDRRVRDERDDGVGVREIEARAVRRQPVQIRRRRAAAVRPERVGAQRVDRDEQDVAVGIDLQDERRRSQPPPRRQSDEQHAGRHAEGAEQARPCGHWRRGGGAGLFHPPMYRLISSISFWCCAGGAVATYWRPYFIASSR